MGSRPRSVFEEEPALAILQHLEPQGMAYSSRMAHSYLGELLDLPMDSP